MHISESGCKCGQSFFCFAVSLAIYSLVIFGFSFLFILLRNLIFRDAKMFLLYNMSSELKDEVKNEKWKKLEHSNLFPLVLASFQCFKL